MFRKFLILKSNKRSYTARDYCNLWSNETGQKSSKFEKAFDTNESKINNLTLFVIH